MSWRGYNEELWLFISLLVYLLTFILSNYLEIYWLSKILFSDGGNYIEKVHNVIKYRNYYSLAIFYLLRRIYIEDMVA